LVTDALLAQWGQSVFTIAALGAAGFAFIETLSILRPAPGSHHNAVKEKAVAWQYEIRRILPAAAIIALLQISGIGLAFINEQFRPLLPIAIMYLFFAMVLPFLWAAGQAHAAICRIPIAPPWAISRKLLITGILAVGGVVLSLALIVLNDVRPGAAVESLSGETGDDAALVVIALWLLFNAPWMEEMIFRHYLVPRLAAFRWMKTKGLFLCLSVVICATVFALGHAGHLVPAWPKLVQTFVWGVMLGWSRIYFGTFSAIGLHLVFNLSAPLVAPFVETQP